jgi:hypothetical protein
MPTAFHFRLQIKEESLTQYKLSTEYVEIKCQIDATDIFKINV